MGILDSFRDKKPEPKTLFGQPVPDPAPGPMTSGDLPPDPTVPAPGETPKRGRGRPPKAPGSTGNSPAANPDKAAAKKEKEDLERAREFLAGHLDRLNAPLKTTRYGDMSLGEWERAALVDAGAQEAAKKGIDITPRALAGIALASWGVKCLVSYYQNRAKKTPQEKEPTRHDRPPTQGGQPHAPAGIFTGDNASEGPGSGIGPDGRAVDVVAPALK